MKTTSTVTAILVFVFSVSAFGEEKPVWEFSVEGNLYILEDNTFFNPVISADNNYFHLEARYNDEDLETGSLFAGYNFQKGEDVAVRVTPMIGVVFGNSNGVAPGFIFELNYKKLSFSSEGEYLFSTDEKESNFFYSWSELAYSPAEWIWFGIAGQRTRAYKTDLDVQRGFLLGVGFGNFAITGYLMDLGWDHPFALVSIEYSF